MKKHHGDADGGSCELGLGSLGRLKNIENLSPLSGEWDVDMSLSKNGVPPKLTASLLIAAMNLDG